jgi:pimeloyl-ACP methyl ester carboxylesterase
MQSDSVAHWQIPEPLAIREARLYDGSVTWLRRHGNPAGPRIVLSHGNGLSADAYYPFWSLLVDHFDLVLYDFRNHGWNTVGNLEAHQWRRFIEDNTEVLSAIDAHFGEKPKIGVFHSMSAVTAVLQKSEAFSALVLFDPPTCPHGRASQDFRKIGNQMGKAATNRQAWFKTRDDLAERLLRSSAYQLLLPGVPVLIAQTTLRRVENGYVLCCPPMYEAQVGMQLYDAAAASDISHLPCPVKVIGADPTVPFSFLPSVDLSDIVALDYDFVPEATHFLQLEQPEACLTRMLDFLESRQLV